MQEQNLEISILTVKNYIETNKTDLLLNDFLELEERCEHYYFWRTYEKIILDNSKNVKISKIKKLINKENIKECLYQIIELEKKEDNNLNDII
jgi:hypothetical protein